MRRGARSPDRRNERPCRAEGDKFFPRPVFSRRINLALAGRCTIFACGPFPETPPRPRTILATRTTNRIRNEKNRHRLRPRGLRNERVSGGLPRRHGLRGARLRDPLARERRLPRLRASAGRGHRGGRTGTGHRPLRFGRGDDHDAQQAPGHPGRTVLGRGGGLADPPPQRRQRDRLPGALHHQRRSRQDARPRLRPMRASGSRPGRP